MLGEIVDYLSISWYTADSGCHTIISPDTELLQGISSLIGDLPGLSLLMIALPLPSLRTLAPSSAAISTAVSPSFGANLN